MKNFKKNAMMQEMNLQEMREANGGFWPEVATWFLGSLAWSICEDPKAAKDSFCEGMSAVLEQ